MRRSAPFIVVIVLLAGAGLLATFHQRQTAATLRADVESRREQLRERLRLAADNDRMRTAQISTAGLEALRNDHAALRRMRGEVEAAKARMLKAKSATDTVGARPVASDPAEPSMREDSVPVELWKNAGSATPMATLETVLWAAAGGDVELLARNLSLSGDARSKAVELFAQLPSAMRGQFTSPEQMIAFLGAKDVPLGSARLIDPKTSDENGLTLVAQLMGTDNKTKHAFFSLRQEGENWKLVVPVSAVEKYAARLKGSAP